VTLYLRCIEMLWKLGVQQQAVEDMVRIEADRSYIADM
jgi:hypothetical protein